MSPRGDVVRETTQIENGIQLLFQVQFAKAGGQFLRCLASIGLHYAKKRAVQLSPTVFYSVAQYPLLCYCVLPDDWLLHSPTRFGLKGGVVSLVAGGSEPHTDSGR